MWAALWSTLKASSPSFGTCKCHIVSYRIISYPIVSSNIIPSHSHWMPMFVTCVTCTALLWLGEPSSASSSHTEVSLEQHLQEKTYLKRTVSETLLCLTHAKRKPFRWQPMRDGWHTLRLHLREFGALPIVFYCVYSSSGTAETTPAVQQFYVYKIAWRGIDN